ncbi:MAG: hypothetical protein NWQ06_08685, partial [Leeuwenhoekiella sp.]|nr:hypothetical protein [Leeuwenhoekiella sp.]
MILSKRSFSFSSSHISAYNLFEITSQTNDSTFLHIPSISPVGKVGNLAYDNRGRYRHNNYASYTDTNLLKFERGHSVDLFNVNSVYGSANHGYDHVVYLSINNNQTGTNLLAEQGRGTLYYDKVKIFDYDLSDARSSIDLTKLNDYDADYLCLLFGCSAEKHAEFSVQKIKIYNVTKAKATARK